MKRALRQALGLLCASTCACGEDVMQLGRSETEAPLAVESLLLRQADTGNVITDLATDLPISLASLASTDISLEAVVTGNVGSVEFVVDENSAREHVTPFTYPGDTEGKLRAFSATIGEHTVVATPYSLLDATGEQGTPRSGGFTFVK